MKRFALILFTVLLIAGFMISCDLELLPKPKPDPVTPGQSSVIAKTVVDYFRSKGGLGKTSGSVSGSLSVSGNAVFGSYGLSEVSVTADRFLMEFMTEETGDKALSEFDLTGGDFSVSATVTGPAAGAEDLSTTITKGVLISLKMDDSKPSGESVVIKEENKDDVILTGSALDDESAFLENLGIDFADLLSEADEDDLDELFDYVATLDPEGDVVLKIDDFSVDIENTSYMQKYDSTISQYVVVIDPEAPLMNTRITAGGTVAASTSVKDGKRSVSADIDLDLGFAIALKRTDEGDTESTAPDSSISFTVNLKGNKDITDIKDWMKSLMKAGLITDSTTLYDAITILLDAVGMELTPKAASVNGTDVDAVSFYATLMAIFQTVMPSLIAE